MSTKTKSKKKTTTAEKQAPVEKEEQLFVEVMDRFDEEEDRSSYYPTPVKRSYRTVDKISNRLADTAMDGEEIALRMEPRNSVEKVTTRFSLTYKGVDIKSAQTFTSFDQEVYDAVISLYMAGNTEFSAKQVFRTMCGKGGEAQVSKRQEQMVADSIDKAMFSEMKIDAAEEMSSFGYHFDEASISGNLLNIIKVKISLNNNIVYGYRLLSKPILLAYAQPKKQITSVELQVLDSPTNNTPLNIVLRGYLVRRIQAMKSGNVSKTILFDTVYRFLNEEDASRQRKAEIRETIRSMLNYWVKIKYIKSYEEVSRGRKIYSIAVDTGGKKKARQEPLF